MINFPPATADGQTFQFNDLNWVWEQNKSRWNIFPSSIQIPIPISLGGTGASTASGARSNLGITEGAATVNFATLTNLTSGVNTDLLLNPDVLIQAITLPSFRYVIPTSTTQVVSGTNAATTVLSLGAQLNYPTVRGHASRIAGGTNAQMLGGSDGSGGINWAKTVCISGRFRIGTAANPPTSAQTFRFTLGPQTNDSYNSDFDASLDRYGVGMRINALGPIELVTRNGPLSTETSVNTNIFVAADTSFDCVITSRNGNVNMYINKILTASTTNGPTITDAIAGVRITAFTSTNSISSVAYFAPFFLNIE